MDTHNHFSSMIQNDSDSLGVAQLGCYLACLLAWLQIRSTLVSTGDTNPHFGDFHFQNLAVIFNYQLSIINYQLSIHRPLSAKEYLPKSI